MIHESGNWTFEIILELSRAIYIYAYFIYTHILMRRILMAWFRFHFAFFMLIISFELYLQKSHCIKPNRRPFITSVLFIYV